MSRETLILTIGQISVRVESDDPSFLLDLARFYPHFVDEGPCSIAAEILLTHQTLTYSDDIIVTSKNGVYTIDGGEFKGEYCSKSRKARFTVKAEPSFFDSFLRVFYSILLTEHNSFLVHAAGLKKNDQAFLFAGPSSAGKTTTASIAKDCTVLNDELTLVQKKGEIFYLHSTPFNGDYDRPIENCSAPLKGFFFLNKDLKEGFLPVDKTQCLIKLLECVFFFDSNLESNQCILNLCHQLVSQLDGFQINILSRQNIWELINEISKEHSYT